jgi:ppGpp synthetase/RelA/SpoT-type nucleotidyltranferase
MLMSQRSTGGDAAFDRPVAEFSRERTRFEKIAAYVCGLIKDHCGGGLIHTTEHRAKTVDSFDKKCRKLNDDGTLRYPPPLQQITDLAGVRVIVFLRDSVDVLCNEIGNFLKSLSKKMLVNESI